MFCPNCGNQAAEGDAFCGVCGADLRSVTTASVTVPMPTVPLSAAAPPAPTAQPGADASVAAGAASIPYAGSYPKAGLGPRFVAYLADAFIASALLPAGVLVVVAASTRQQDPTLGWVLYALGSVWLFAYLLARDAFGGAGPGKRLAGLTVISVASGAPQGGGPAVVRQLILWLTGLVPIVGGLIEPVLVLTDRDGRRLGDRVAKTQVVRVADVAARGLGATGPKTPAVIALVGALVVALMSSGVGGFLAWRGFQSITASRPAVGVDPGTVPEEAPEQKDTDTAPAVAPSKDPVKTVESFYAALSARDFDALRALYVPDMADAADPELYEDWQDPSFTVDDVATDGAYAFVQVNEFEGGLSNGIVTFTLIQDGGLFLITGTSLGTIDEAKAVLSEAAAAGGGDAALDPGQSQVEREEAVFTKENAIDAVGNLLNALRTDDMKTAKSYATARFKKEDPGFFRPSSDAFLRFEVVDAVRDGGTWVVTVKEQWISGPETVRYVVVLESMACRVDQQIFE